MVTVPNKLRWRVSAAVLITLLTVPLGAAIPTSPDAAARSDSDVIGESVVRSGVLQARVERDPWRLTFTGSGGRTVLREHPGEGPGPTGTLGFRADGTWRHATHVISAGENGETYIATLATTDPLRRIRIRLAPDPGGVIGLEARVLGPTAGVDRMGIGFRAREDERYLGSGERSNAVDQRSNVIPHYVEEGPYQDVEYPFIRPFVPPWGIHNRDDATYFPMPWLVSTAGYGVLVDNTETSRHRLGTERPDAWSVEVDVADTERLRLRVFAGPQPRDVLRRMTASIGRQPEPAAPWFLGAWYQPTGSGFATDRREVRLLREKDVPVSVIQQSLHYLPCGDQRGRRARQRRRTDFMHEHGLAITAYVNPMICRSYSEVYDEAEERGLLTESPAGTPSTYTYQDFVVGQLDFTAPGTQQFLGNFLSKPVEDGYDGWMEDFGEYTPPQSRASNGQTGRETHNVYPKRYHCASFESTEQAGKPLATFIRSGWTGVAPCARLVWGGDPTSGFGFDGIASAVKQGLTMGLSGISLWGSDIGGFFELSTCLTEEELKRWVQFGVVSGFFETRARGIDGAPGGPRTCGVQADPPRRPQVTDPGILPLFRRYASLRTQLYPYIKAADAEYRRTGMPIMRHLALVYPDDPVATAQEDQYLFGQDLLAAPVLRAGARTRQIYLPRGKWIDFAAATEYRRSPGGLRLGSTRVRNGRQRVTVPAPLTELPLMVRAGTILPLLPPSVDTLADFPAAASRDSLVSLEDRRDHLDLLAFPRGGSVQELAGGERIVSSEQGTALSGLRDRPAWELSFDLDRQRHLRMQASLATLRRPFTPCRVLVDGHALPGPSWSFDAQTQVLRVRFDTRAETLRVVGGSCAAAQQHARGG